MNFEFGDLWDYYDRGWSIVVTTNIGWKKDGTNVMGAGVARQAADRFSHLPRLYGDYCIRKRTDTTTIYYPKLRLFMLPTKRLNLEQPWLSWQANSSYSLIAISLTSLRKLILRQPPMFRVALGYPGCGNGGLEKTEVAPLLDKYLGDIPAEYSVQLVDKP